MTAFSLSKGQSATVVSVTANGQEASRLKAFGIQKGAVVTLLQTSLFHSAVLLGVGTVRVAISKKIATGIEVSL